MSYYRCAPSKSALAGNVNRVLRELPRCAVFIKCPDFNDAMSSAETTRSLLIYIPIDTLNPLLGIYTAIRQFSLTAMPVHTTVMLAKKDLSINLALPAIFQFDCNDNIIDLRQSLPVDTLGFLCFMLSAVHPGSSGCTYLSRLV